MVVLALWRGGSVRRERVIGLASSGGVNMCERERRRERESRGCAPARESTSSSRLEMCLMWPHISLRAPAVRILHCMHLRLTLKKQRKNFDLQVNK
ncbi:hypothetical protein ACS0TY_027972 [Phlomoides rotata]